MATICMDSAGTKTRDAWSVLTSDPTTWVLKPQRWVSAAMAQFAEDLDSVPGAQSAEMLDDVPAAVLIEHTSASPPGWQFSDCSLVVYDIFARVLPTAEQASQRLRRLLTGIQGVEGILARETPDGVSVSIVANHLSREQRREIYDREWELMQFFVGTGFDFHLVDRQGRELREVVALDDVDLYLQL